jgi:Tfp pilus assembly protein PilZ
VRRRRNERRVHGFLRVPLVRRCRLLYEDGQEREAFVVNISVHGAYIAEDELPRLGRPVVCMVSLPGNEREIRIHGEVAWLNPRQQHPVHSLPPGFGLQFREVSPEDRERLEGFLGEYVNRLPQRSRGL